MPTLPFTHEQFISVFAAYNQSIWPAQIAAYLLGVAVVLALLGKWRLQTGFALSVLALMWAWTGVAYHWLHFASINKAAGAFGGLFVLQAVLLGVAAIQHRVEVARANGLAGFLGWALIAYALVLYPLIGMLLGQTYPGIPMFGVTPCPVTIFTFGILLLSPRTPWWLMVVPTAWSLIGGSAAFLLRVPQDWVLLASFLSVIPIAISSRRHAAGGAGVPA
ncbi:MAG TPA: DUF6064 family protein [Ramlibacter sp.]|nr:DUF6064 family protein [Ramlibacter sp.]